MKLHHVALFLFLPVLHSVYGQSVENLMNQGMELLRNGAYSQAVSTFRKVLSQNPRNFEAQHNLGFSYLQMRRYNEASTELDKATRLNSGNPETWSNLAIAYEGQGQSPKAIQALSRAINLDPSNITARMNLATMYANEKQLTGAINQFKEIIRIDSGNIEAYTNLAKCLISRGNYEEAKQYIAESLVHSPRNAEARYELGNIMRFNDKDLEGAAIEYELAIQIDPHSQIYYNDLGTVFTELGKTQMAIDVYKKYLIYLDDVITKEQIRDRIRQLEQGESPSSAGNAGSAAVKIRGADMDLRRDDSERDVKREPRPFVSGPEIDITEDFKTLNEEEINNDYDFLNEIKKRTGK